jgi:hypothetical protein
MGLQPHDALAQVNESGQALGVPLGDPLWIVSAAWADPPLASRLPAGLRRDAEEFGRISVIKIPHEISPSGIVLPQPKMESSPVKGRSGHDRPRLSIREVGARLRVALVDSSNSQAEAPPWGW